MFCQVEKGKDLVFFFFIRLRVSFFEFVGVGGFVFVVLASRKVYDTRDDDRILGFYGDCDDDKYRRRFVLGWLVQLFRYIGLGVVRCQEWGGEEVRVRGFRWDDCMIKGFVLGNKGMWCWGCVERFRFGRRSFGFIFFRSCFFVCYIGGLNIGFLRFFFVLILFDFCDFFYV